MKDVIGRNDEQSTLSRLMKEKSSEFVAVYGRRRVGKTYLIKEFFQNNFDFFLTGLANTPTAQQLNNFNLVIQQYDNNHLVSTPARDWLTAFHQLTKVLEANPSRNGNRKVVFIDELPWLDTPQSGFMAALEYFWNSWASARKDIILVVCGSATSWMINKLIHNTGGLYNRVTYRMKLEPFNLAECEKYFQHRGAAFTRFQVLQLFMTLGGIPFYLKQVDTAKSAAQNIQDLCFKPKGLLHREFDALYRSIFANADKYITVVETLSQKLKGLTREELIERAGLNSGGGISRILKELEESNFIRKYKAYGKKQKNSLYQLSDFYSLFYLRFMKTEDAIDDYNWLENMDHPKQRAWAGYAFEQVCMSHTWQIKKALGISGVQTVSSSWTSSGENDKGAQIDLVIDRRDGVVNLCEMKFSINPFTISKKYEEELRNKIGTFREETNTRKAIFLTMITTFGLKTNMYSNSVVQNDLNMEILFEK